jgi:quercetin dioxygenase-like cupin family protein
MAANPLPNPDRYITDNNDDGQSFFSTAAPVSVPVDVNLGGALQRLGYTTDRPPVKLTNDTDLLAYEVALKDPPPLVKPGGGANVWYIDIPPDSASPLHRTVSLDFVIMISGEVELTMSNNDTRTIKPGDMVIQRSTLHLWRNTSKTQWSRMAAVMTECQPVVTKNAGALGEIFPSS